MKRLPVLLAVLYAALSLADAGAADRPPNIVFIMADDLGLGDLGCYGGKEIPTPNIERLATEGLRFTNAYSASAVCAPTRCGLMTGLHMGHATRRANGSRNGQIPLAPQEVTIAELLQGAGYATGGFGKWGLGNVGTTGVPEKQGFDIFYGYYDQTHAHNYFPEFLVQNSVSLPMPNRVSGKEGKGDAYSPDLITDATLTFIEANKDRPFFCYAAWTLPHGQYEIPDASAFANRQWPQPVKNHAAMIARLDADVGRVVAKLQQLNLAEKTLIIFTSDNGAEGPGRTVFNGNAGLRGFKRHLYEGGIRAPFIARWPGKVAARRESDLLTGHVDFLATACELAGVAAPAETDGISIVPTLLGRDRTARHDWLYWEIYEGPHPFQQAVRMNHWKGYRTALQGPLELYDLQSDPKEQSNIASDNPDVVAQIENIMTEQHDVNPNWTPPEKPADKEEKIAQMSDAPTTTVRIKKKRSRIFRACRALIVLVLLLSTLICFVFVLSFWGTPFDQSRRGRVPLTPPWALECWLWEDDVNNAAMVKELLEGYAKHDIPVRAILIDSPWSDRYNDFKVDENRYPEPEEFFRGLQDQGYRVVLWMTCMVDSYSKDTRITESQGFYDEAQTNGYLAGSGEPMKWWKGKGGFIDYSNADAMKWWHGLQQQVLDWGVDGWKLDGVDTLFSCRLGNIPAPFNRTHAGWITTRQYMDLYARNEYQHGLTQNPEFATLIRAMDGQWTHPEGFAPLDAAPVTWVGDNQHTWKYEDRGIEDALTDILGSARLGYCVIGSDVAGYHGRSNPDDISATSEAQLSSWKPKSETPGVAGTEFGTAAGKNEIAPNIYIRWAQFSTFCGLFLNGGHGERRLWKRTQPELEIIRKFSWLHTELVPYIYSHVVSCHNGGLPLMRPLDDGTFHYLFGDDFLVAPIHEDKLSRTVSLPPGGWRYLFDDGEVLQGPRQFTRDFPLDEFPVFVRDGAVLPLKVTRPYTGFGDQDSAEFTTWLIYPHGRSEFTLWGPESHPNPEGTTVKVDAGPPLRIEFSSIHGPHILRIAADEKPASISLNGQELLEGEAWTFEADSRRIIIKTRRYVRGDYLIK